MPRPGLLSFVAHWIPLALLSCMACLACLSATPGCVPLVNPSTRPAGFGPTRVRIHPTFTRIKDWTGDNKPDGIEVVVEFLDEMDEPVRAAGKLMFELYNYRRDEPNPATDRISNPWIGSLLTKEDQVQHWSPALRAYTFQLARPGMPPGEGYVLAVTFEPAGGGARLFNRIILEPPGDTDHGRKARSVIPDRIGGNR